MGSCLSKKNTSCSSSTSTATATDADSNTKQEITTTNTQVEKKKEIVEAESVKKEVFVIKHRKSHEVDRKSEEEKGKSDSNNNDGLSKENGGIIVSAPVRTSSCSKEEVDAILIQCGRLSRSSSTGKTALLCSSGSDNNSGNPQRSRKYSGSKRSFDFENENGDEGMQENVVDCEVNGVQRHRQRQRQPRTPSSPSKGRRRTPSRERDQTQQQQGRSGSKERGTGGGGSRRVSRSPNRRSDSPITTSSGVSRPGKMVSVPATVSSTAMDKSIDAGGSDNVSANAMKRIQVKRNVGADGSRSAASPRAARVNGKVSNENQQQPVSLSRSNSRKQEQSPYRRNPLGEIDTNVVIEQMPVPGLKTVNNNPLSQMQKLNAENVSNGKVAMNVIVSGGEMVKPQGVTRSRSIRLSRELDVDPEALTNNPPQSYTALLLEDIQNFHQKGNNTTTPAFSLPPCVTKACSILDAVADLNSTTSSNPSNDRRRNHPSADNACFDPLRKKKLGIKDPFVESEVDIMEPSIQKYVTFRRGTDIEDEESSGSNSMVGCQQNWLSSSSWEPNSADSTDCWTSSKSYDPTPNKSQTGIGRGRVGSRDTISVTSST